MPAVGPRVSKEEFMHALGLNSQNPQHEQYYRAMRDEAILIYNRLNADPSSLLDSILNPSTTSTPTSTSSTSSTTSTSTSTPIKPPFFWHHIRPERQRWGILEIWRTAGPATKPLFDRGGTSGEYGPNWVAGWLLYSVFRSRDVRNNRSRKKEGTNAAGNQTASSAGSGSGHTQAKKGYYDPVRNGTL